MALGRIALLFGGRSTEHEVSVRSARSVADALSQAGFDIVPIAVDRAGRWLTPALGRDLLAGSGTAVDAPDDADALHPDLGGGGLRTADGRALKVDVVFPLVHGQGGEDGRYQAVVELAGLPYVGAGVLASAAAMDKDVAKRLLAAAGLPVTPGFRLSARQRREDEAGWRAQAEALGFPLFVKPVNGGSSVGVRKVETPAELVPAVDHALRFDGDALVERGIDAREIECAVIGNDVVEASVLGEIVPTVGFYDYAAKYVDDTAQLRIPAPLDDSLATQLRDVARQAYMALGLTGLARVDFLVERQGSGFFINEVNTLPGFTSISMFPKLWAATGLSFPDLVRRLVELAIERHATRSRLETQGLEA